MIYEEEQKSPVLIWSLLAAIFIEAAALVFVFSALSDEAARTMVMAVLGLSFAMLFFLFTQMRTLSIRIDSHAVSFGFGFLKSSVPVGEIEKARIINFGFRNSGGWGIRYMLGGSWNWIAAWGGGVEIVTRSGKKRGFSTGNPDRVKDILNSLIPGHVTDER